MPRPARRREDVFVRFSQKIRVNPSTKCWEWIGGKDIHGYGRFQVGTRANGNKYIDSPHRFSYETYIGKIPIDRVIDHLCRNRACVKPTHLELVTNRENILRGDNSLGGICRRGHSLTDAFIYWAKGKYGYRTKKCKICKSASEKKVRLKKKGIIKTIEQILAPCVIVVVLGACSPKPMATLAEERVWQPKELGCWVSGKTFVCNMPEGLRIDSFLVVGKLRYAVDQSLISECIEEGMVKR